MSGAIGYPARYYYGEDGISHAVDIAVTHSGQSVEICVYREYTASITLSFELSTAAVVAGAVAALLAEQAGEDK